MNDAFAWFTQNLALGASEAELAAQLRAKGMDDDTVQAILERSQALRSLAKAPYDADEEEEPAACCSDPRHQHR